VDNTKESLTTLSLCTGYGGIERGLEFAGEQLDVLAHVEIEAFAIANLVAKMEEGKLAPSCIWSNLKTIPVEPFRDRVDLITGGYPCQPFSAAGKRAGTDDPRHLWPYIRDIIESVRPVRCFFENVEGHISLGLREVISDLESLGYKTTWGIFSATEVGAPHQRKRVYILADSQSLRVQGLRPSGEQEPSPHGQEELLVRESKGRDQTRWDAEPNVGRVVDGCALELDIIRRLGGVDEKGNLAKANTAAGSSSREVLRVMWKNRNLAKTSPRLYVNRVHDPVPDLPCGHTQKRWLLGERLCEENDLCDLWRRACEEESEDLFNELFLKAWGVKCKEEVGPMKNRVDRIRLLGNAVVPQTAAKAWQVLNEELAKND